MGTNPVIVAADVLLRRVCLPATLLASAVFRYNILSLVNLLLFLFSLLLPGPRLKARKGSYVIYLVVVIVWSLVAAASQSLFQIVLASEYADQLLPCSQLESSWRQFGFVLFEGDGVRGVDIARHLVPDCAVFLVATINLVTTILVVISLRVKNNEGDRGQPLREEGNEELNIDTTGPSYPSHIQCYWQLPQCVGVLLEVCIFIALGLSGVAVPSLTSFVYYVIFLLILISWSFHRLTKFAGMFRVFRCGLTFYVMTHLLALYLYQFQAAQDNIPIQPYDSNKSLLARLFGLTPVIFNDCQYPTQLMLHPGVEFSIFINPCVLVILSVLLSIELRLWINTPEGLWRGTGTYHYPVADSQPSPHLHLVSSDRSASPVEWSHYGTYQLRGASTQVAISTSVAGGGNGEDIAYQEMEVEKPKDEGNGVQLPQQDIKKKMLNYAIIVWSLLLTTSYIPAIVCMMLWSVFYPSWPALLLLLWACIIWLIPRFTPKDSLFYTSPALVFYAVCLLLLQYIFSLNLTSAELSPLDGLGQECDQSTLSGCKSIVPFIKTLFTITFFCAFHEFVRKRFRKTPHSTSHHHTDGEMPLIPVHAQENQTDTGAPNAVQEFGSKFHKISLAFLSRYWVLVVVGAFFFVFLTGPPNLLNTVYLVFFFVFLITYQVFRKSWYYICVPVWWGLVVYAALELTLVYTYQFDSVRMGWERALNNTQLSVDPEDLFNSIGFREYGINSLRDLCVSLIPPAVFIAVMAIQLRYFNPLSEHTTPGQDNSDATTTPEDNNEANPNPQSPTPDTTSGSSKKRSEHFVKMTTVIFSVMLQTFWRALEIHLHKLSMLVIFIVVVSEISAGYWLLLVLSLIVIPLPYFNSLLYPLLTLYIGILSVLKTVYQFPIVGSGVFNLTDRNDATEECSAILNTTSYIGNYSGTVYDYCYSSRLDDGGWLGFHKVSNYPLYIIGLISVALLLSLYFSTKRRQIRHYETMNIHIMPWEKKSLFLNVPKKTAENSLLAACKFIINHFFEMYGVEITFIMMVITVAVRIDVYGVLYCILLGLFLLIPRGLMAPLWLIYIVIYSLSLLLQYFMLLGVPPGACFSPYSDRGYPWDTIVNSQISNFGMKKWLFLSDYPQMLDRSLLYGTPIHNNLACYWSPVSIFFILPIFSYFTVDFVVYILLCLQVYNFKKVPELCSLVSNFLETESLLNFLKVLLTRYFIWVTIFLVFVAAISRVSFFGFFYLIVCFSLLYRGENMLLDKKRKRNISWNVLRLMALLILLVKVSLQVVDCVFYNDLKDNIKCYLILAVNGGCNRRTYYGSPPPQCDFPNNVGLWVDALTFAVFTIQIAIFDSQFSEIMRDYLVETSTRGDKFTMVLDEKMAERQQRADDDKEAELLKLRRRIRELNGSENIVEHILHAGVRIPSGVSVRTQPVHTIVNDEASDELSDDEIQPKSKVSSDSSKSGNKLTMVKNFAVKLMITIFDRVIEWLERSSSLYVEVVTELKRKEKSINVEIDREDSTVKDTMAGSGAADVQRKASSDGVQDESFQGDISKVEPENELSKGTTTDEALLERELGEVAEKYSKRPMRLLRALQYALIAHAEFVIFFLVILNVILNGNLLSLGFALLLFSWGLFCIPWPTKTFWLTLIFYSMMVLVVKYLFQFSSFDYHDESLQSETGFSTSTVLGIEYHHSSLELFKNVVWDMLLLIALLINRGLLKQNGLWRQYTTTKMSFLQRLKGDTKQFYLRLLSSDINRGAADYYVVMLFLDFLCMITIILGVSSFGVGIAGRGVDQTASFIQNNYIPLPFVLMLLLQFLFMIIDRAIYLRRAIKAKFSFQIFLLFVWNIWLLFILPSASVTKIPFTMNTAAQFLYFFKCLYFIVSAMQIVSGYPANISGYFLGRHYDVISGLIFNVYRAVPLLPELREVIDWVFTDTALSLLHWLRVQEIYAKLYLVKVRRQKEKGSPRDLGNKQGLLIKVIFGGVLLTLLVLLIWGPLLVISFINTTSVANTPVATSLSLSLNGYEPLVQISIQQDNIFPLNNSEYRKLINSLSPEVQPRFGNQLFNSDFVKAVFPSESTSLWTISPPAKQLLINNLESVRDNQTTITVQFSWEIKREPVVTSATEIVTGAISKHLNYEEYPSVIDKFISTLSGDDAHVSLSNLYPRLIFAPTAGSSRNDTDLSKFFILPDNISCSTSLSNTTTQEWWTLNQCTNPIYPTNFGPPILLIYSERVAPQIFGVIAGFGIIGLYVSVVLVIGRFIRSYVSSLPTELLLDEIVYPDPLIKLCHDIFLVRQSKDFKLEEILVGKLFSIFRSPQKLMEVTEIMKDKQD